jgi:hypothetical protein
MTILGTSFPISGTKPRRISHLVALDETAFPHFALSEFSITCKNCG